MSSDEFTGRLHKGLPNSFGMNDSIQGFNVSILEILKVTDQLDKNLTAPGFFRERNELKSQ